MLRLCETVFTELDGEVGLQENVVNTMIEWQGQLYIGTDDGLEVLDADKTSSVENYFTKELEGDRVRCLMVDSNNHLWACTSNRGLLELIPGEEQIGIYDSNLGGLGDKFRTVIELKDGTIAVAGDLGIMFIKDGVIVLFQSGKSFFIDKDYIFSI